VASEVRLRELADCCDKYAQWSVLHPVSAALGQVGRGGGASSGSGAGRWSENVDSDDEGPGSLSMPAASAQAPKPAAAAAGAGAVVVDLTASSSSDVIAIDDDDAGTGLGTANACPQLTPPQFGSLSGTTGVTGTVRTASCVGGYSMQVRHLSLFASFCSHPFCALHAEYPLLCCVVIVAWFV
jgi:hypothetical protein